MFRYFFVLGSCCNSRFCATMSRPGVAKVLDPAMAALLLAGDEVLPPALMNAAEMWMAVDAEASAVEELLVPMPPKRSPPRGRFIDHRRFRERLLFHDPTPLYFEKRGAKQAPLQRDAWSTEVPPKPLPTTAPMTAPALAHATAHVLDGTEPDGLDLTMFDAQRSTLSTALCGSTASAIGYMHASYPTYLTVPQPPPTHEYPQPPATAHAALGAGVAGTRMRPRPPGSFLPKQRPSAATSVWPSYPSGLPKTAEPKRAVTPSDYERHTDQATRHPDQATWRYARADVERELLAREAQAQSYVTALQAQVAALAAAEARSTLQTARSTLQTARSEGVRPRARLGRPSNVLPLSARMAMLPEIRPQRATVWRLSAANFGSGKSAQAMRPPKITDSRLHGSLRHRPEAVSGFFGA